MEEGIKKWWFTMSEAKLHRHLVLKLKYPQDLAIKLVERVMELKAEQRKAKIKQGMGRSLWDEYLAAPRHETAILRVIKSQLRKNKETDTPKWHAVCAYEDVINAVMDKLKTEAKNRGATPTKLPGLLHAEGYTLPRNNGEHWTDYVKQSDLQRIRTMFDSLPPPARGKHKTPFNRALPPKMYKRKRLALIEELNHEIEAAERERSVYDKGADPEVVAKLDKKLDLMYEAQYKLDQHKNNTPLPNTWHGIVGGKGE